MKEPTERRRDFKTRAILSTVEEGVVIIGTDGKITMMTEAAERIFERPRSDVIGKKLARAKLVDSPKDLEKLVSEVLEFTQPRYSVIERPGEERVIGVRAAPYYDRQGKLQGAVMVVRDITELDREKQRAEAILASTADGLVVFASDGQIVYINPAAEKMLGYKSDAVIGQYVTVAELFGRKSRELTDEVLHCWEELDCEATDCPAYMSEDPRCWVYSGTRCRGQEQASFGAKMDECRACNVYRSNARLVDETGMPSVEEIAITKPHYRLLRVQTNPVLDSNGHFLGFVKTLHDITSEREVEQMKNEFVSTVSHELRTPLTSIKGYVDLILEGEAGEINETQREFLDIVKQNNDRLVALINDLLDISRIESGRIHLKIRPLDMREIVEDSVATLRTLAERKNHCVSIDVPKKLPLAAGDHDRVSQVVVNFLSNAIKYTPPGGKITVKVRKEKDALVTSVEDNGIGISDEDKDKLFSKFFRVDSSLTQEIGGSGLGLSICKTIVELHGGDVWVESEVGKGSTFSFSIPVASKEAIAAAAAAEKRPKRPCKVLVVDDEPEIAKLIEIYLRKEGYDVVKAFDGEQAVNAAIAETPDIITLDIMMDQVDGFEVLGRLKDNPDTAGIPVVVVSIVADEHKSYKLGAADYITKPIDPERLTESIGGILSQIEGKKKILVVDDDRQIVKWIRTSLEKRGYQTVGAYNGLEALVSVQKERPDLVLLDLRMPEMDGYQVIEKLKKSNETADIPIIVMTAYAFDRTKTKVLSLAAEQLSKPFSVDFLTNKISEALEGGCGG